MPIITVQSPVQELRFVFSDSGLTHVYARVPSYGWRYKSYPSSLSPLDIMTDVYLDEDPSKWPGRSPEDHHGSAQEKAAEEARA